METINTNDNPNINAGYAFGLIQGLKLALQKVCDQVNSEPDPAAGGHYVVLLSILFNDVNSMPTVAECGKFKLDLHRPEGQMIAFDWITDKKNEMLNLLTTSN